MDIFSNDVDCIWEKAHTSDYTSEDIGSIEVDDEYEEPPECILDIDEFMKCCEIGGFVDDDGYGELIDESGCKTGFLYSPSEREDIPKGYPQIIWYNK